MLQTKSIRFPSSTAVAQVHSSCLGQVYNVGVKLSFPVVFVVLWRYVMLCGASRSIIAFNFVGSGLMPSAPTMCQRKLAVVVPNSHLLHLQFNVSPASLIRFRTARTCIACSAMLTPWQIWQRWLIASSKPSKMFDTVWWNISRVDEITNGSQLNVYLPNGVMNIVIRSLDSTSRGICQNPEFASTLVINLALLSLAGSFGQNSWDTFHVLQLYSMV